MESLVLSFEAVMPIFILMLVGYFIKNIGLADKKAFDAMNKLVFKLFLPVLLFYNIYKTETVDIFNPKLVIFAVVGIFLTFLAGYAAVLFITKDNARRGVMLQGFFRANYAILGIPLVNYICGESQSGMVSLLVAFVVPVYNILSVVALERFGSGKLNFGKLLLGIIKNPLIIACFLGVLATLLDIRLPGVIEKSVSDISKVASPLAIIVLGASFTFSSIKGYVRDVIITVGVRLVLAPLVLLTAAIFAGFRGEALACLLIAFGAPVAVSSFAMAQQMGGDEKLAAQVVVVSSAACLFTLFLWIFSLSTLGLL